MTSARPPEPSVPAVPDFGLGPAPEPGRVDEVAPGVRRLTAPNAGLMTGPGTNTYLVGDSAPVVIDPGPADAGHTEAILAAATPLGPVRAILVTHTHVDHAPGAR
ncbi:MAG TPA: MBL fold metallo-hydrolase, partial [Acidimicrobiales bacterium]